MKRAVVVLLIVIVMGVGAGLSSARGGKPNSGPTPAKVTIWDGNQIQGDGVVTAGGGSVYINGVGGVVCTVDQAQGSTGNFLLNITKASRPKRWVTYNLSQISAGCDQDVTVLGPVGTLKDAGSLAVHDIVSVPVDTTSTSERWANFFTSLGTFNFFPEGFSNSMWDYHCSTQISVQRTSMGSWDAWAYPGTVDNGVVYGNVAQLNPQAGNGSFAGNYSLSFHVTIELLQ